MNGDVGTRAEHLAWAKERALNLVQRGELQEAFFSMVSDLGKHSGTEGHIGLELGGRLLYAGHLSTAGEMRRWIEGFN